jgi:hypothetical protein
VTLTGINFVKRSVAFINGEPIPTTVDSATKLHFVLPQEKFAAAGKLHIVVKNPQPVENADWGDTSNTAHIHGAYPHTVRVLDRTRAFERRRKLMP